MQADKLLLEAKLKEALSAQPAALDPHAVAGLQEKLRAMAKENDLLKVALAQEKTKAKSPAPGDSKTVDQARQALTEANRKLAEETHRANSLAQQNTALQGKLAARSSTASPTPPEPTKPSVANPADRSTNQAELNHRLELEKQALQARVLVLTREQEAIAALRAENEILKKQLAGLKTPSASGPKSNPGLAEAQAQIAALQSDKELLRLEKTALENRLKQVAAAGANVGISTEAGTAPSALKEGQELATLKARLQVLEARAVPYTAEELALFKRPPAQLAATEPKAGKKPSRELPAGTAKLAAEAQRHFSARQFDKAEEKYLQMLRQDENNVNVLANLATIELEQNHLDQADKHLKQALAESPNDAYSLSVLGYLRFRQERYDEALEVLSRAAQLSPENAEVQNFLGLTLSHKGMRIPAETALRKAVQLAPGYGGAHVNLAVIYATQQPALVELARWHYQKALSAGHARNPDLEKILEAKKNGEVGR